MGGAESGAELLKTRGVTDTAGSLVKWGNRYSGSLLQCGHGYSVDTVSGVTVTVGSVDNSYNGVTDTVGTVHSYRVATTCSTR